MRAHSRHPKGLIFVFMFLLLGGCTTNKLVTFVPPTELHPETPASPWPPDSAAKADLFWQDDRGVIHSFRSVARLDSSITDPNEIMNKPVLEGSFGKIKTVFYDGDKQIKDAFWISDGGMLSMMVMGRSGYSTHDFRVEQLDSVTVTRSVYDWQLFWQTAAGVLFLVLAWTQIK